jgi:cytochrome c
MKSLVAFLALITGSAAVAAAPSRPASFAPCAACHQTKARAKSGIGPNLWGVSGRISGTASGFAYSPAMKAAKIRWSRAALIAYINDPRKVVPGNKMPYAGLKDPKQDAAIADYLLSLK